MTVAYYAVTIATILANAYATFADVTKAKFIVKTAGEIGVALSWFPLLAACKALAVLGLLAGLLGFHAIGTIAAAGLVIYFIGAVAAHLRARVFYNIAFPTVFLALAIATLALSLTR